MEKVILSNGGSLGIVTDKGTIVIDSDGRASVDNGTCGASYDLFGTDAEGVTGNYNAQQNASLDKSWNDFTKQAQYIQLLVQIQGADHNVHKELDEAILKLKELTYA